MGIFVETCLGKVETLQLKGPNSGHKIFDMLSRKIILLLVYKQNFDFELGLPEISQKSQKLVLPWLEIVSMFPHCALSWCQYFHIVRWVGVNVSTLRAELASMFPHCALGWSQCFRIMGWYGVNYSIWKIDSYSARNVETLTQTQRTLWKHWHQLSAWCGYIDTKRTHNLEMLTPTQRTMWKHWHDFKPR